jgi:CRISPR/Cas system-associated exonuclease Cas4 (RecB family)
VWRDGIDTTKADLREWLRRMANDAVWQPWRYELGFGLPVSEQRDPHSQPESVTIDVGVTLRGSIDLVEHSVHGAARATDYKTGKPRAAPGNIIGGGRQLQPALYALVLEKLLPGTEIDSSRLYYCTQAGGFQSVSTPLNQRTRDAVSDVMKALSMSFEKGFFPAAPHKGECTWCEYQPICGPDEERRVSKKLTDAHARHALEPLTKVRALP